MPRTDYISDLDGEQIEAALEAIHDVVTPSNNGKVLCIVGGHIAAKSASEWGGGGYPEPTGTIPITANGTVNVKDYETAEVNVPGSITAADEGKVVKNGVLVAQTARANEITTNGTYDTTENNSVTVNVSGGGPADDWTTLKNYIQSNGTQWIDTGYVVTDTSVFELIANINSNNASFATPFGTRESSGSTPYQKASLLFAKYSNASTLYYNWGTNDTALGSDQNLLGKKAKFVLSKARVYMESLDNYIFSVPYSGGSATQTYSLYLFSLNQGGSELGSAVRCNMQLYRFRIYEGDTLLHEYLPWQENGVACLKDTITSNLLYNAGTGNFVYGTDT